MGLPNSVRLHDALDRSAVAAGNVIKCVAPFDPMMHDLRPRLRGDIVVLCQNHERLDGSVGRQFYTIAGRYHTRPRAYGGIPTQKLVPAETGRFDERGQRRAALDFNFF